MTAHNTAEPARLPLTRDRILARAIEYADTNGLEAMSMRKLGGTLGVEAMSLYNHISGKDDLIAGMVDLVMEEVELPDPGGNWKQELETSSNSAHDTFVDHPWIAEILMKPIAATPNRFDYMEAVLATLRRGGFSVELTHHAFHALETHTIGYTMQQVAFDFDEESLKVAATDFLTALDADTYHYLAEHIGYHVDPPADDIRPFHFGLGLILDGIERMRDQGRRRTPDA